MRVDVEAEPIAEFGKPGRMLLETQARALPGQAENNVFNHRQRIDEHEVLVDHADAQAHRLARRGNGRFPPLQEDVPAIGLIEPIEDVHEGRLAGAVLAENGVYRAFDDVEIDPVQCLEVTEQLADLLEPKRGRAHCRLSVISLALRPNTGKTGGARLEANVLRPPPVPLPAPEVSVSGFRSP